jgi:hypothetical protein
VTRLDRALASDQGPDREMPGEWLWTLRCGRGLSALDCKRLVPGIRARDVLRYERTGEGLDAVTLATLARKLSGMPVVFDNLSPGRVVSARRRAAEAMATARRIQDA